MLTQLSESHPELPLAHVSTGDLYRQLEQWEKSITAYDRAIELYEAREEQQAHHQRQAEPAGQGNHKSRA